MVPGKRPCRRERRRKTAVEPLPSLQLHHLPSTSSPPPTQALKKKTQYNDGTRSAYTPTSSIWGTAPSPAVDLDGSRSVCWRVFTCSEPAHIREQIHGGGQEERIKRRGRSSVSKG
ncbi:hypothetical protein GW17_00020297 [Ensete ventricosum]|nr:hypothetical protein GW17_00020297 [Ensete ventricosum]RZR99042.1 hypothetical protein BHM03_00028516 [Ensete ventricosum]